MSGHSRWSQIKRQKGTADQKRAQLFTQLGRVISLAAKNGGDPGFNFSLRLALDRAKTANMPKDTIERAIKRGTGELLGEQISEVIYEGFGPGGVGIIVESLTDNPNRSVADIRNIFSQHGGSLGSANSVLWQFLHRGVLAIKKSELAKANLPLEDFELRLIDSGATDIKDNDQAIIIQSRPEDLQRLKTLVESSKLAIDSAGLEYLPKETVTPGSKDLERLTNLLAELEECEDVKDYYTAIKEDIREE